MDRADFQFQPESADAVLPGRSPLLTIHIVSLFPQLFDSWLQQGVVSRAVERSLARVDRVDLREFGEGRHKVTDDYPFGGGPGMVMKVEPVVNALRSIGREADSPVILLSPQGNRFTQRDAEELSALNHFVLVAGHYEGVDERILEHVIDRETSIGDYVLSCGELAAMVVADAVVRLLPGALAADSTREETFSGGLLEYPQYTRPAEFGDWRVPDVLLSGHHAEIARWRRLQSLRRTFERRPDLLVEADLNAQERAALERWAHGHMES